MRTRRFVPTMPSMTPEQVKESLTLDQYKLYKLVWEPLYRKPDGRCAAGHRIGVDWLRRLYL